VACCTVPYNFISIIVNGGLIMRGSGLKLPLRLKEESGLAEGTIGRLAIRRILKNITEPPLMAGKYSDLPHNNSRTVRRVNSLKITLKITWIRLLIWYAKLTHHKKPKDSPWWWSGWRLM